MKSQNRKAAETMINKCIELHLDKETMDSEEKALVKEAINELEKQLDKKVPVIAIYVCPDNNEIKTEAEGAIDEYNTEGLQPEHEVKINEDSVANVYID